MSVDSFKGIRIAFLAVAVAAAALLAALSSTLVSRGQTPEGGPETGEVVQQAVDPGQEPFPTVEALDEAQSIVAQVVFNSPTDVEFVGADVSPAPAPARIGGPPLVQIEALDDAGTMLETYNGWHPLWTEQEGEDGEPEFIVEETGEGRFIIDFVPDVETVKVTDIVDEDQPVELIEFDVHRTIVGYCAENPDDPGCKTVCIGDVDRDGEVTFRDIMAVGVAISSGPDDRRWNPDADVNQDGRVNEVDLLLVLDSRDQPECT